MNDHNFIPSIRRYGYKKYVLLIVADEVRYVGQCQEKNQYVWAIMTLTES